MRFTSCLSQPKKRDRFALGVALCILVASFVQLGGCGGSIATTTLPAPSTPSSVVPSAASSAQALVSDDWTGSIEHLCTLTAHTGRVTDLAFSPDGAYLATSGTDGKVRLWEVATWRELSAFAIPESDLNVIAFSPDGRLLACGGTIWDVRTKQALRELTSVTRTWHPVFSPDGSMLAAAAFDGSVQLIDVSTGQTVCSCDAGSSSPYYFGLVFSPDGRVLAGGTHNGTVVLWDAAAGRVERTLEKEDGGDVHDVTFSPDGRLLAGGGTGPAVRIWAVASGETVKDIWLNDGLYGLAFSPDGSLLALAGCNRRVQLYEVKSGKLIASLRHADELMAVAFSPDGSMLATGCFDNTAIVWRIER